MRYTSAYSAQPKRALYNGFFVTQMVAGLPLEQHDPGIGGRRGSSSGGLTVTSGSAAVGTNTSSNTNSSSSNANSSSSSNLLLTAALQEEEKCSLRGLVWKVLHLYITLYK
jgi:hypothetical protein